MAAFEYLKQYSTFNSVEEMDQHVEQHIQAHFYNLTESERAIVFKLASRSLEYPGASHLKASTIADSLEISTKTVYRAIKKLVELNIIEKVEGKKLNGIKGASIYKLLPYNVPSEVSQRETARAISNDAVSEGFTENQPLIFSNQKIFKDNNTYPQAEEVASSINLEIDKKDQTPYQKLKSFVKLFIDDNKLAYKLYGIWLAQTKTMITKVDFDVALRALKVTMNAIKTKGIKSITGYFNGVLNNLINKWLEEECDMYAKDWTLALDTDYELHEKTYLPDELPFEEEDEDDEIIRWLNEMDSHPQIEMNRS